MKPSRASLRLSDPAVAIATWFGCGYTPVAPGTAASFAALALAYFVERATHWHPLYFAALGIALTPIAIFSATETARQLDAKDPRIVVVDEVLGQWITLAG